MKTYRVELTGTRPLLMHWDNIAWAGQMKAWESDPKNQAGRAKGDDRSPAYRWLGCLYHDDKLVSLPSDNLMRCLMEGGAMVPVPGGKSGKTFKAQTQSGCMVAEPFWPLRVSGREIPMGPLFDLKEEDDFDAHQTAAAKLGFSLFLKRAKIGQSKHVRVRPRFDNWSAAGTITVWDEALKEDVLRSILSYAGLYKGLCDWRPGGKTPGPHGMFTATVKAA